MLALFTRPVTDNTSQCWRCSPALSQTIPVNASVVHQTWHRQYQSMLALFTRPVTDNQSMLALFTSPDTDNTSRCWCCSSHMAQAIHSIQAVVHQTWHRQYIQYRPLFTRPDTGNTFNTGRCSPDLTQTIHSIQAVVHQTWHRQYSQWWSCFLNLTQCCQAFKWPRLKAYTCMQVNKTVNVDNAKSAVT